MITNALRNFMLGYKTNAGTFSTTATDGTTVTFSINPNQGSDYERSYFAPGRTNSTPGSWGAEMYGTLYWLSNGSNIYYGTSNSSSKAAYAGVILGNGSGTPSASDYALFGSQITDFTAQTTVTATLSGDKIEFVATYNITNTGASDIVITEIAASRPNTFNAKRVLLTHDVFDNPITIAPGDTGIVIYKLTLKF